MEPSIRGADNGSTGSSAGPCPSAVGDTWPVEISRTWVTGVAKSGIWPDRLARFMLHSPMMVETVRSAIIDLPQPMTKVLLWQGVSTTIFNLHRAASHSSADLVI